MKTIIIISLLLFGIKSFAQTTKFEKPRYLKHATLLCPIDITKSYSKEGLIGANTETITLIPDTVIVKERDIKDSIVEIRKIKMDTVLSKNILIEKGFAFDVVQEIGSYSIIKFWDLSDSTAKGLLKKMGEKKDNIEKKAISLKDLESMKVNGLTAVIDNVDYDLSKTYYILPTKTLINNSTEFENKKDLWSLGLLVLPVKIRPFASESGQFDFSGGFSVGTTFAWTVHHNWQTNFTHNFLIYAGISSYKADESKIKEEREDYTIATFSPALGWMWEKNNVQLSVLVGIDFPPGELQKNWVYRNQPWVGLGVGIALFKIDNGEQTKNGTN